MKVLPGLTLPLPLGCSPKVVSATVYFTGMEGRGLAQARPKLEQLSLAMLAYTDLGQRIGEFLKECPAKQLRTAQR